MKLSLRWGLLVALIATLWGGGTAQERLAAVVLAPQEATLFGWAQQPPTVTIEAALQRGGDILRPYSFLRRLYLTAQIRQGDRLIDTVPLWDDGTHGDKRAKDGVFAAHYLPPQEGSFRIRVRAQAEMDERGKTVTKEIWSDFVSFRVVPVPYPRLISPEPGSRSGQKVTVRARLLILQKPFEQEEKTLQATLQVVGEQWSHQAPMHRRGSLLTAQLTFPKQGRYQLIVRTSIQREGQTLQSESELTEVEVVRPNLAWLIGAIVAFVSFLLLPPRQPPLRYRHYIRINGSSTPLQFPKLSATHLVGNSRVEIEASGTKKEITIIVRDPDGQIRRREYLSEGRRLNLNIAGKAVEFRYERAEPYRDPTKLWHRLLPNTTLRFLFLALAIAAFAYWVWQWRQFAS